MPFKQLFIKKINIIKIWKRMYVKQLVSNAENNIRSPESGGYHKKFLSRRARTIISMCEQQ